MGSDYNLKLYVVALVDSLYAEAIDAAKLQSALSASVHELISILRDYY
jgi:hypothetical protein